MDSEIKSNLEDKQLIISGLKWPGSSSRSQTYQSGAIQLYDLVVRSGNLKLKRACFCTDTNNNQTSSSWNILQSKSTHIVFISNECIHHKQLEYSISVLCLLHLSCDHFTRVMIACQQPIKTTLNLKVSFGGAVEQFDI